MCNRPTVEAVSELRVRIPPNFIAQLLSQLMTGGAFLSLLREYPVLRDEGPQSYVYKKDCEDPLCYVTQALLTSVRALCPPIARWHACNTESSELTRASWYHHLNDLLVVQLH
eukprot:4138388-Pyramimonas_sp.AAC.2